MCEGKTHKYMRPRDIVVVVFAETGVTPPEPDQYWSVLVTDAKDHNPDHGRSVWDHTNGKTSMKSLTRCIRRCLKQWKEKFDSDDG